MPFGPPDNPDQFDTWEECVEWAEDQPSIDDEEEFCGWAKDQTENQANAMTQTSDTDSEPQHRAFTESRPGEVELREVDDQRDDGLMAIRLPIASTGEVRNEGDDPLTREELDGMARQINEADVGVFLSHGDDMSLSTSRYGQTERLGNWTDAEVVGPDDERALREDAALLMATAEMPDPETLPDGVKTYRETLGILKEQARRDIGMSASIGWREAEGEPGGNDLMEASIVGIPADPRTVTQGAPAAAVARAAVDAGADPDDLVAAVRAAVDPSHDAASAADVGATDHRDMTTRAPEDFSLQDWADLFASHFDGVSAADFMDAWDGFADDYIGAVDLDAWAAATATVVDADSDAVQEALQNLMTDNTDESGEQSADETDDTAQTEREEAPEWAERMLELLGEIHDSVRQEDDDDEMEDEDDEDEDDEDMNDAEDTTNEQAATEVSDLRQAYDTLREGGIDVSDVEMPDPETEQDADADDGDTRESTDDTDHPDPNEIWSRG